MVRTGGTGRRAASDLWRRRRRSKRGTRRVSGRQQQGGQRRDGFAGRNRGPPRGGHDRQTQGRSAQAAKRAAMVVRQRARAAGHGPLAERRNEAVHSRLSVRKHSSSSRGRRRRGRVGEGGRVGGSSGRAGTGPVQPE